MVNLETLDPEIPLKVLERRQVITIPVWIDRGSLVTLADVYRVYEEGCDSGAYLPAVRCREAYQTMIQHYKDVEKHLNKWKVDIEGLVYEHGPPHKVYSGFEEILSVNNVFLHYFASVQYLSLAVECWVDDVLEAVFGGTEIAEQWFSENYR